MIHARTKRFSAILLLIGAAAVVPGCGKKQAQPAPPASSLPVAQAAEKREVIVWDGEAHSAGEGWENRQHGVSQFKPSKGASHSGSTALKLYAMGKSTYSNGGWEWAGWWPKHRGTDIRGYKYLPFWAKVGGSAPISGIDVSLKFAPEVKESQLVDMRNYTVDLMDGQWHQVTIPLKDLYGRKTYNTKEACEVTFGSWIPEGELTLYIDDIGFTT